MPSQDRKVLLWRSEGWLHCETAGGMIATCWLQVVVDLPENRRNRSPQRQAPSAASPTPSTHPQAQPQSTDPDESEEDQGQGQVLQRPFSSRPDGGIGWVEPDAVLSTFAATADSSSGMEADALKAQGALFSLIA